MKRALGCLICAVIICLISGCVHSSRSNESPQAITDPEVLEEIARVVVEQLSQGEYSAARQQFESKLRSALPGETLKEIWEENTAQAGAFNRQVEIRTGERQGRQVVIVTCQFEEDFLDIQLVFNEQAQITGLFFAKAKPDTAAITEPPSQTPAQIGMTLKVRRMFGLSLGNKVRSRLDLLITKPDDLHKVSFFVDGQVIETLETPPFMISIHTDSYPPGWHQISALGESFDGVQLASNVVTNQFLSPEEANRFLFPILGGVAVLVLIRVIYQVRETSKKKHAYVPLGTQRVYGLTGGSICPRCRRPFPLHAFAPEIITGKLDACPHCGRIGLFSRASLEELRQAELREAEIEQPESPIKPENPEKKLRRQLEDSRFRDNL